ncbi:DUF418 domain-containing protein [Nonomuraea sp. NPDC050310]|uniref:DUF418 domain-containing protein n=1 Tax=Nonomuraea sp. NPDC050310 TaxID=3154935 RepID=UPI003410E18B
MTRIRRLDALRGFAVCGIMVVNTWQHSGTQERLIEGFLQGRFYPIFSALFGVSFVLILRGSSRWMLLRRLLWLFCFGVIQHTFYPGEVLTDYAFWGALALLPASFLPGLAVLALGVAAVGVAIWQGGGAALIPGLLLVGMAIMELRPPGRLLPYAFVSSALLSGCLVWGWLSTGSWLLFTLSALSGAAAYATGFLLLPPFPPLERMGRMALTNYLSGTVVIALTHGPVWTVAGLTLAVQAAVSWWWLSAFRYGPLEWVWRCLTRLERVPNRRILQE